MFCYPSQSILLATSDQLHYTTKRTMVENEQITTELTYQSKETERVVQANKRLMKDNADLRREIEVCRWGRRRRHVCGVLYRCVAVSLCVSCCAVAV